MGKYISFGKCNRNYYFILGSIAVKFIRCFIYGYTPILKPNNPIYIFGFKSQIFSRPLISYCFQYLSMIIGSIVLQIIYNHKNKSLKNTTKEEVEVVDEDKATNDSIKESIILEEYKKNLEMKNSKNVKYIVVIFIVYFVSQYIHTSLNQLGFNRIKFWSLEPIFLYIFSKKKLKKIIYKHQKISIIALIICCTAIFIGNSFIPYSTDNCNKYTDKTKEKEQCEILNSIIYQELINKLKWFSIPIIILLYLATMIGNSYSTVSIKWLVDINNIKLFKILLYLGISGFVLALIELIIFSQFHCIEIEDFALSLCTIEYKNKTFYDNYKTLSDIKVGNELYIDIFAIIPIFLLSSFLDKFFDLLIIVNLDPFYLIPIDCIFYFILEIVDYIITFPISQRNRNLKFMCRIFANVISIFLCGIYLEIIELNFWNLDQFLRRSIIKRENDEKNFILLEDINNDID